MKRYFLIGLLIAIVPNICFGGARFTQLVREKERKMAELEKCMGSTKGLKIAGVSTLGLTAVGVSANIAEASTIKSNIQKIDKAKQDIKDTKKEIGTKEKNLTTKKGELEKLNCTDTAKITDKNVVLAITDDGGKCIVRKCTDNFVPNNEQTGCMKKDNNNNSNSNNKQESADCTDEAKKSYSNVKSATWKSGQCVIEDCEEGYHVDGDKCVEDDEDDGMTLAEAVEHDVKFLEENPDFDNIARAGHVQVESSGYNPCVLSENLRSKLEDSLALFRAICEEQNHCKYKDIFSERLNTCFGISVLDDDTQIESNGDSIVIAVCAQCSED